MRHVHSGKNLPESAPETGYSPRKCCSESPQECDSSAGSGPGWAEPLDSLLPAHSNAALTALEPITHRKFAHVKK